MGELLQGPWPDTGRANLPKGILANDLGVSTKTIERWMKEGLPYERTEKGYAVFNRATVRTWLAERERKAS